MDVNRELISRYADGQATEEERKLVEAQLRDDPQSSLDLDEYRLVEELFGHVEPESVSEECLERLYAVDGPALVVDSKGAPAFERISVAPVRRIRWGSWAAAAAAIFLAVVGVTQLTYKPDVQLRDFARLSLDATGAVVKTERLATVSLQSGDELVAGPRERITYRDELGARVVLMPESRLELGDPREGEIMELTDGTALLTLRDSAEERLVQAGGYTVHSHGADFAVRVRAGDARAAGASLNSASPQVVVAVRAGSCEVGTNGDRQPIEALWSVVLQRGTPAERTRIWEGPLFNSLMEQSGRELLAGYYSGEAGVRSIRPHGWSRVSAREQELVVLDNEAASVASWIVIEAELDQPGALEIAMLRPLREQAEDGAPARKAVEKTLRTPIVPAGRQVLAIALNSFQGAEVGTRTFEIPGSRSRLVRLRLRAVDNDRKINVKRSLWSARPPAHGVSLIRVGTSEAEIGSTGIRNTEGREQK